MPMASIYVCLHAYMWVYIYMRRSIHMYYAYTHCVEIPICLFHVYISSHSSIAYLCAHMWGCVYAGTYHRCVYLHICGQTSVCKYVYAYASCIVCLCVCLYCVLLWYVLFSCIYVSCKHKHRYIFESFKC